MNARSIPSASPIEPLEPRLFLSATLVKDVNTANSLDVHPHHVLEVGGTVFFTAHDNVHGLELWKLDDDKDEMELVADLLPGPESSDPVQFRELNGNLYFFAIVPERGRVLNRAEGETYALWSSDGTRKGTRPIRKDFRERPYQFQVLPDRLLFAANDGRTGRELWQSDGTCQGATLLPEILPGALGSGPYILGLFNDNLLISATDAKHGCEPWLVSLQ